jgi:hypothetical protein
MLLIELTKDTALTLIHFTSEEMLNETAQQFSKKKNSIVFRRVRKIAKSD